jgi:hypothetical protein
MSSSTRHKRPELDRFEPMRSLTGLFGPPRNGAPPRGTSAASGTGSGADGVSRGVDLGYRVIEEYMRQGQSFARSVWSPRFAQEALGADPQQLAGRMYQYASDFAGAWLEYLQAMMAQVPSAPIPQPGGHVAGFGLGDNGAATVAAPPAARPETTADAATAPTASVQIASRRRTEVTADLKPGPLDGTLSVFDLRARDASLPRISGVAADVSKTEHRITLRIEVPDDQPAGIYTGLIVDDATNLPRGTLTVRVFE